MKKLFIAVLAMACLASCEKSQVIGEVEKDAITFGNSFVDNSTKAVDPSLTKSTLNKFLVYGKLTNDSKESSNLFNGIEVFRLQNASSDFVQGTDNWGYAVSATRYWIPGNSYRFAAVACSDINEAYSDTSGDDNTQTGITSVTVDYNQNSSMPTSISFASTDGTEDLLYSEVLYTNITAEQAKTEEVNFTFSHLLSKVKFIFKNKYALSTNLKIKVSEIKILNPYTSATCAINNQENSPYWTATWYSQQNTQSVAYEFGNAVANNITTETTNNKDASYIEINETGLNSYYERLLIPAAYKGLKISYKADVYLCLDGQNDVKVTEIGKEITTSSEAENAINLVAGNSYNFIIELGEELNPIKFTVTSVEDWKDPDDETTTGINDQEIPIVEATPQN